VYEAPEKPDRPGRPFEAAHIHDDVLLLGTADSHAPLVVKTDEAREARWVSISDVAGLDVRGEVPELAEAAFKAVAQ
jgi:hypothetical protein